VELAEGEAEADADADAEAEADADAEAEAEADAEAEVLAEGLPLVEPPPQVTPLSVKLVGIGLTPVQVPLKPTCTEPPVAMAAFQLRLVTVTFGPVWFQVPFQPWLTVCPAGKAKARVQPLIAAALLTIVMLAPKPVFH
jgi:hypothetical protein